MHTYRIIHGAINQKAFQVLYAPAPASRPRKSFTNISTHFSTIDCRLKCSACSFIHSLSMATALHALGLMFFDRHQSCVTSTWVKPIWNGWSRELGLF